MTSAEQDGSYPRPQLVREQWHSLDGPWRFAFDDDRVGEHDRWFDAEAAEDVFPLTVKVPFPPESAASGVHDPGFHPVVWYRRDITADDLGVPASTAAARDRGGSGSHGPDRTLVHFGAVDYSARVWFDGVPVGEHAGGQTPFHVDVTDVLASSSRERHVLVVRAEDDPLDPALPRGKQDWEPGPHGIWYHRTTGIWQSVWTETVPALRIVDLAWTPDIAHGSVRCELTLSARPTTPVVADFALTVGDEVLAAQCIRLDGPRALVTLTVNALSNGQDRARLLWSPEHPVLVDARVELRAAPDPVGTHSAAGPGDGLDVIDTASSYLGIRSVGVGRGQFLLNNAPYYVRSVLDQGYWKDTHLANPGAEWLRGEVELIKAMGFNAVRIHQKAEDPRFLYWADRLGLLVWGETANAYEFSVCAIEMLTREWSDLVLRDRSHPCVVTWVPINESWGVQDITINPAQQAFSRSIADLTRALDPSRPVVSNEGWEHLDSDILGLHDYTDDPDMIRGRYGSPEAIADTLESAGPGGRVPLLGAAQREKYDAGDAPLMITEFGGISYAQGHLTWGYSMVHSDEEYENLLSSLFDALRDCPSVVGFCYTQLIDTEQEANGLLNADRSPKLPMEMLYRIVTGQSGPIKASSTMGWVPDSSDPPGGPPPS